MWRMRRRSRTICLSLALISIFLHLLLSFVSLSFYHLPCAPPPPPSTHILRDLARTNYTSTGISSPAESPTRTTQRHSSHLDADKDAEVHVQAHPDKEVTGGKKTPVSVVGDDAGWDKPSESGLSKLEALFDHPLYNLPGSSIPEDDWLLKVKPKVKASEKSSQMWFVQHIRVNALTSMKSSGYYSDSLSSAAPLSGDLWYLPGHVIKQQQRRLETCKGMQGRLKPYDMSLLSVGLGRGLRSPINLFDKSCSSQRPCFRCSRLLFSATVCCIPSNKGLAAHYIYWRCCYFWRKHLVEEAR